MPDRRTVAAVRPADQHRHSLRDHFDFNDPNEDGRLTLGEFIRFVRSMDPQITAEECQSGFDEVDANRDGLIDFGQFAAWWAKRV
jgi:Ca2+-binding EF-hand superfamily protein